MRASEFLVKESKLITDVPNENWLQGKIDYAKTKGRDSYGVPYMNATTAYVKPDVRIPVDILKRLPGMRGEQKNVRHDDLKAIMDIMRNTGKLPLGRDGTEYAPFVLVAHNGEAWVSEGNHRIMAAVALGWDTLPVELKYFDGGERIKSGPLYPGKIGLGIPIGEADHEPWSGKQEVEIAGYTLDVNIDGAAADIRVLKNQNQIGYVIFDRDGKTLVADDLAIDKDYQGLGIAKLIYDYVKNLGYVVKRSVDQTRAGQGFWDKHRPNKSIWEQSVAEAKESIKDQIEKAVLLDGGNVDDYFVRSANIDKLGYSAKQTFGRSPDIGDNNFSIDYIGNAKGKPALWFYPLRYYLKNTGDAYATDMPHVWLVRIKPDAWLQPVSKDNAVKQPAPNGKERVGILRKSTVPAAIFFKPAFDVVDKFYDYGSQHKRQSVVQDVAEGDIDEMALSTYKTMGDFEKPGPFRAVDKKLVTHEKSKLKAAKFFEKTPYDFRLFFSNVTGTQKHKEHGSMNPGEIRNTFSKDNADQILNGHEDAITVVYVGNFGDAKVMMTPWIMAHRLGHALARDDYRRGSSGSWKEAESHFFTQVNKLLDDFYGKRDRGGFRQTDVKWDLTPEYNALFNATGTQRSSRTGQIRRPYEFLYELFAQYLGTGKITLNPLPVNLGYGRKAWGTPTKYLNIKPQYRDNKERAYAAEVLAADMEVLFNSVLSEAVGKIFVM